MRAQILGLGVVLLAVQGCSGGPTAGDTPVTPDGQAERLDCAALITTTATDALGWPATPATEHAGRCQVDTDRGEVTVGTRAVVPDEGQERSDAVQEELEAQCDRLRADGPHFVGEPDWLADGTSGCLTQLDPRTGTGVAELVLRNRRDEVVQIRVPAFRPVAEEKVDAAMRELAGAALDLCEAACA
ncbi:MAG TPA: hypothetical protein VNS55_00350 [Nocardioides sp.]|nr:hypothetical protein [Nocardioides sp.]